MNLCKDCKHSVPDKDFPNGSEDYFRFAKCGRETSPVTGMPDLSNHCTVERNYSCGSEGKFWESKIVVSEQWGQSPGMASLPDVRMLNAHHTLQARTIDRGKRFEIEDNIRLTPWERFWMMFGWKPQRLIDANEKLSEELYRLANKK